MNGLVLDARVEQLLAPVRQPLATALEALPGSPLHVTIGSIDGFGGWQAGRWVLDSRLEGPAVLHPEEPSSAPLDRWKRAMASVLEGVAWADLARHGFPTSPGWWEGAVIAMADAAAPYLGLLHSARVEGARRASIGGRGAALLFGTGARDQAIAWRDGVGPVEVVASLRAGLRQSGLTVRAPVRLLPCMAAAGEVVPVRAERPGRLDGWPLEVGEEARLWAWFEDASLTLAPVPIEGAWDLVSTEVQGQILGARGVTFRFKPGGRVDLVFADAFVGPLAALEMARQMGHSGLSVGRWEAVGPSRIRFGAFRGGPITMHQRDGSRAMPQVGFGVTEWVTAMEGTEWTVSETSTGRVLSGSLMEMAVQLRLVPERV